MLLIKGQLMIRINEGAANQQLKKKSNFKKWAK